MPPSEEEVREGARQLAQDVAGRPYDDLPYDTDEHGWCQLALHALSRAALTAAQKVRAAASQADGWRPIETAPRDGTAVLLYCPTFYFGAGVYVGWWTGSLFEVCTEGATDYPYSDDGATHWRPLPPPPEGSP